MVGHTRGRSYCHYGLQEKTRAYMSPVPFYTTQEAWFLRPNLGEKDHDAVWPASNIFNKEGFSKQLPITKPIYDKTQRILLTINNELFFSNKFKTPLYTFSVAKGDKIEHLFRLIAQ